ncbi:hypothetical protein FQA39_LY09616 [Lamprigera yunnana]|nr:hypothetical protein FQA39_LY09616 [Lamprigera yunnana]
MSSGFSFGQKPNETPTFGQSSFGTPQFGSSASATTTSQFGSTFGTKPATGGFQFSTPTSTPAFGTSLNFNTPTTQQNVNQSTASFGFNNVATPSFGTAPSGAFGFSSPPPPQTSTLFGTPASTAPINTSAFTLGVTKTTGVSFGTPTSGLFSTIAPTAPGTQTTGINFGTSPSAPTATGISFGRTQLTAPKMPFGTPSTSGGFSFGPPITPAAPTPGLFTMTTSAPTSSYQFGPPTTSTAPPLKFVASQATPPNLSFSTSATTAPLTGLAFAMPTSSMPQTSLTMGTPNLRMNFATTITSTPKIVTSFATNPTFGVNSTSAASTGITFKAPALVSSTLATTLNFPAPASTAPSIGLAFPIATTAPTIGLTFPTTTTTTVTSITSSLPTTITTSAVAPSITSAPSFGLSTPAVSFSFGPTTATTAAPMLSFGTTTSLGGISTFKPTTTATTTTTSLLPNFGLASQLTSGSPKSVGLGGVNVKPIEPATVGQSEIAPKDQLLPNELMQTVEQFKKFVQEQKHFSSEIARFSIKDLKKVEGDIELINNCMHRVENELRKNKLMAEKLKLDTARDLQHVEMAQRTYLTPAGLQYENTAPFNYFIELSDNFEKDMQDLRMRIESIDKYMKGSTTQIPLSSKDLALGMRRLHETFVTLAGRLQIVHSQVELQKEQYLKLRKQLLNDHTNVFEKQSKGCDAVGMLLEKLVKQQTEIRHSPTPFTPLRSSQVQATAQYATTPPITLGQPITTGFNVGGTQASLFGNTTTNASSVFNSSASNAFQLQKPPVGNKRGKP